jgi:RsmE family RNA methyltransferase
MNLILLESATRQQELSARDKRFDHIRGVLRMRVGDAFVVGLPNGPMGKATVTALTGDALHFEVEWGDRPQLPPPVTLLLGMCRPAAARRILQTLPTLGIRRLVMFNAGRSDRAYARSSLWTSGEWNTYLLEGVEQACDTYVPVVDVYESLDDALGSLEPKSTRIALDVYAEAGWPRETANLDRAACLAIGPERGWNQHDRAALASAEFETVRLLKGRVMRCETAVTVGLTLLLDRLGVSEYSMS